MREYPNTAAKTIQLTNQPHQNQRLDIILTELLISGRDVVKIMGRKRSSNPHAILSISLPLTTRSKLDAYNPRNRSAFVNQAILNHIRQNDRLEGALDDENNPYEAIATLTTAQVASVLMARLVDVDKKQLKKNLLNVITDPEFRQING